MQTIFLSFSYREKDSALVRPTVQVLEILLDSFGIRAVTGEYLAGAPLTASIKNRIENCGGLIALLTPDASRENGKYTAHTWARDEFNYAKSKNIPSIALLHELVENEGIYADHEYALWKPADSLMAILKIGQAVGQWRRNSGKSTKIKIIPEEIGFEAASSDGECLYRLFREGIPTDWRKSGVVGETGGAFAHLHGLQDDSLIQFKVKLNGETWLSRATPQFIQIQLKKEG